MSKKYILLTWYTYQWHGTHQIDMSRQYVSLDMAQLSMTWHTWRSHLKHTAWHCHVLSKCPAIIISAITHTSRKVLYVLQSREVIFFGKSDCWWIASMKCWSWCSLTTWGQVCVKKLVWMNLYCRTKKKLILEEKAFIFCRQRQKGLTLEVCTYFTHIVTFNALIP